ncbi:MAG: phosphoglucomutase/phosphomannomutase family protein [Dehalococcoidia bacterium]|nr:phosphoglucomutase/phosphomannomutase family protein [Dehalococcoidia bacterium]
METTIHFGTDGWRAVMNDRFIFGNVRLVAQAIATFLIKEKRSSQGVAVGYDARFMSERFAQEVCSVLAGNGIPCYLPARDIPTPLTAYSIVDKQTAGAVMITASHNPSEYNGMKFMPWYVSPAGPEITSKIEAELATLEHNGVRAASPSSAEYRNLVQPMDTWPAYARHIGTLLKPPQSRHRVVVDPMYGSGRGYLKDALADRGASVEEIHGWRDPLFGGSSPEPSAESLRELSERVKETGADLGLAGDGDADRFGVVDRDGAYVTPNQIIALLLWHLVKNRGWKGPVVRTVTVTHLVDAIARDLGLDLVETPVGFKWVGEVMREQGAVLGGEESGGLSVKGHIPEKDGILANCFALEMVDTAGASLGEQLEVLFKKYGRFYNGRANVRVSEEAKAELMKRLTQDPPQTLAGKRLVEVNRKDGAKLIFDDQSWLLARPSGTEDMVRIYLEAHTQEDLAALKQALSKTYSALLPPL